MFVASAQWIRAASAATYQTMREARCTLNSCVEAGCIAVGLAQAYGYLCEPVPVQVRVLAGRQATMLPGPGSRRRDGFAGHLVVAYPGADIVVDLTSDQFHTPARGLLVPAPGDDRRRVLAGVAGLDRVLGGTDRGCQETVGTVMRR